MPFDVRSLHGTHYTCEPRALRRLISRVAAFPTCPTARDLAKARAEGLDLAKQAAANAVRAAKGKVGVIPIYGPVDQRWSASMDKTGGTPLEFVSAAFDSLMNDSSVGAIVFDIDSPGGTCSGVEELADKIFNARSAKPSYAISNSMACSAAYWIATAAGNFTVTTGGEVGSVGVYCVHCDESAANEATGYKVTCVQAGQFKTEFAPWAPLSDEARARLQEQINAIYGRFVSAVARNRGTTPGKVRETFGKGAVLNAEDALAVGMVDRIGTFDELLTRLVGKPAASAGGSRMSTTMLRLRTEHDRRKLRD